jgi:hypothetical protein
MERVVPCVIDYRPRRQFMPLRCWEDRTRRDGGNEVNE